MKILIIQPYHKSNVKTRGRIYMSQLTLPLMAALTPSKHQVSVIDENVEPLDFNVDADLISITALTPTAPRAYEIADEFRRRGKKVVLGGVHPSLMAEEAAAHADAVVVGESEDSWPQLLADLEDGGMQSRYLAEVKPDLVGLPMPRRDLMKEDAYLNIPKVETSRGCPYRCSFCSTTVFYGPRMRFRPVEEVVKEVRDAQHRFVFFTDNNITANKKYAKRLFRALEPLGIHWLSQGSIDMADDPELMDLAQRSGCAGMLVGFESLSDENIEGMGKKASNRVAEYEDKIKVFHSYKIGLIGCFVFGFDGDDKSVFKKTVKFIKRNNIDCPQLTVLTPYPGTAIRSELESRGRIIHSHWEKYDVGNVTFIPKKMTAAELQQGYNWACEKVYSIPAIVKRGIRSLVYMKSFYRSYVFTRNSTIYRKLYQVSQQD
ncbi:ribosomal protein S12 methylthiotransferase RimO [bacterium BMS3Abin01]|nr:ribosomal protein S12 methylthiotransferase RimO [bacterium BMS3Abin01]HDY69946.1 B12-binding domain-containing radical SAM protein [Actinomycetota bacterium]